MEEYIEKRAALDEAKKHLIEQGCDCEVMIAIFEELQGLPTADVAPVVHGKWIPTTCIDLQSGEWGKYRCSLCGRIEIVREPYCNCGAKMDLEE